MSNTTTRIYSFTFNTYESGHFTATRYPAGAAVGGDWVCVADSEAEAESLAHAAADNEWSAPESRDPHGFTVEFCDSQALSEAPSAEAFEAEFRRVFGSIEVADGGGLTYYSAEGWPEPVLYDFGKGAEVLARFADGHGATERGDSEVCAALEAAGAVIG